MGTLRHGRRQSYGDRRKTKTRKIGIVIAIVLGIVVFGLMFTNGILAFNQENLEKSIQKIPDSIPKEIKDATNIVSEIQTLESKNTPGTSYIETIPNEIMVGNGNNGWLYGKITPHNLKVIENPRYNQIHFSIKAEIIDLAFDESVNLEIHKTTLIGDNSKKYTINLRDCVDQSLFGYMINGKNTNTKSFNICFDVDKDIKKFDIMFVGLQTVWNQSNIEKIGTIYIKN